MAELLSETESLCPECLNRIPARRVADCGSIYLEKDCPEHGKFRVLIWRSDAGNYLDWGRYSEKAAGMMKSLTEVAQGCPFDCGLCPEHKTNACTMVMEVTPRCNLRCPVCFASAGEMTNNEPDLKTITGMYQTVLEATGTPTIQLSGGEPTVRDDLPEIVALGRRMGFEHIMVNTNGVRIAKDRQYLHQLVDSGASTIYLQFDGVSDDVYRYTRGANLTRYKTEAIDKCAEAKIGVVLVPTIVPGVNGHQMGEIVRFAKERIPVVRGVHFQPVSYFGRYPGVPEDKDRITIPDVIDGLVRQTGGEIKPESFLPRRARDAHCSFSSLFILAKDGRLQATTRRLTEEMVSNWGGFRRAPEESARSFMSLHWRSVQERGTGCCGNSQQAKAGTWDEFYQQIAAQGLTITCMPFQDVWSLDLERLKGCCGHLVTTDRRIIPFCAYYLTSISGQRLYPSHRAKTADLK